MAVFEYSSEFPVAVEELFAWHERAGAFERLAPPWVRMDLVERVGGIHDGGRVVFDLHQGPVTIRWEALHSAFVRNEQFVDNQLRGPFRRWRHTHKFVARGADRSELHDIVEYEPPLGALGGLLAGGKVRADLARMFRWRHARTARDLRRHGLHQHRPRLRVAVSGASGMVGSELVPFLTTGGHEVVTLVRRPATPGAAEIHWRPGEAELDPHALAGFDGVVHLSGETVAQRWTEEARRRIRDSRVKSTRLLAEALARLDRKPRVLVCASATGFYGSRGDEILTELSGSGAGFLAEVCREWEEAADAARDAGIRVVHLRIGIVLSPRGGALAKLLTPFSLGAGGPVGNGRQWWSWISLDDLVGAIHHALQCADLSGPVNAVAPAPPTNRDFVETLGQVLHRPTLLPAPGAALRVAFGEMADEALLASQRVIPTRLAETEFSWMSPSLEQALEFELGRWAG